MAASRPSVSAGFEDFLFGHRSTIAVIGGLFLCLLGLRIILSKPATIAAGPRKSAAGLAGDLVGTFMLMFWLIR